MKHAGRLPTIIGAGLILAACGENKPTANAASSEPPAAPAAPAAAPPATPVQEDGLITARARLDQAMAAAKEWQVDAQLAVVTTSLAEGPSASFWFYDVQSPSSGMCTRIRAMANGSVENVGGGEGCALVKPVSIGFVDSPVAYEAATGAGFKKGESVQFGLRFQRDKALPAPRECWVVWSDADGDEESGVTRGWCVDPATGAFVTRLSGYGRIEPLQ